MVLSLTVPGTPAGQGSMTLKTSANGKEQAYYSTSTVGHRNLVVALLRQEWAQAPPLTGAVALRCRFVHPRPDLHYLPANTRRLVRELREDAPTWHSGKRDTDKHVRLIGDALTISKVLVDDGQIALIRAEKVWGETGLSEIEVWVL